MRAWIQTCKISLAALVIVSLGLLSPAGALAAQTASSNYQVNEAFFGSGGELHACSTSFCSKQAAGESTVGLTSSPNFKAQGGFNTNREPYIEFTVGTTNVDLGTLSTAATQTTTANFTVKSYLAHGYVVINASDPPANNSYLMQAITIPAAAQAGTEQFGINLVANTAPQVFGASPTQSPDSTFGFGQVTANYNSPNFYKYAKGDVIAQSYQSSSYTNYTISYIFNISNVTPGGSYVLQHDLVATATF